MRNGVGREHAANANSPARLGPGFNPQKFPSASGALGTWATTGRPLGRINSSGAAGGSRPAPGGGHLGDAAPRGRRPGLGTRPRGAGRPARPGQGGFAVADLLASTCRPAPAGESCTPTPSPGATLAAPSPALRTPGVGGDPPVPAASGRACSAPSPTARPGPAAPSSWSLPSALPLGWDIYFWWRSSHCLICSSAGQGQAVP